MQLEEIIENVRIPELKNRLIQNKKRILFLKSKMSDLTFYIEVARYAHMLDDIEILFETQDKESLEKAKSYINIAHVLEEKSDKVRVYATYRNLISKLEEENKEYFKAIQISLRQELLEHDLPEIYVYQGCLDVNSDIKLAKHIIIPGIVMSYKEEPKETIIYPPREFKSNREIRKFYNKVSYKYLEQLTTDNSFSTDTKRLGKIKKYK